MGNAPGLKRDGTRTTRSKKAPKTADSAPAAVLEKTEPAPIQSLPIMPTVAPLAQVPRTQISSTQSAVNAAVHYNSGAVNHGLNFPVFDPNSYFATDYFSDSSPIQRTTKVAADQLIESIEEKRQTLRVANANIGYNQDVVRAGNDYRKLEGLAIDYAATLVQNQTKYIGYETAGINQQIAGVKKSEALEKLNQENKTLSGLQSMTALIEQEWEERKKLKQSKIADMRQAALRGSSRMDEQLNQMSSEFRQDLQSLPSA